MYLYHCTTRAALLDILQSGWLYNQPDRRRLNIQSKGEGRLDRRVGPADVSSDIYDEAIGVYFRVTSPRFYLNNGVCLVFKDTVLKGQQWYLNTTENNGFYLTPPLTVDEAAMVPAVKSPFSGYKGKTYSELPTYMDHYCELVIINSVSLEHLSHILYQI